MRSISDIQAPQEPNAHDTFDSLRLGVQQHAARTETSGVAQPHGHAEFVALLGGTMQGARKAIAVLEHAPAPTTPAGADRGRELAAHRDLARAYGELLAALDHACGPSCSTA